MKKLLGVFDIMYFLLVFILVFLLVGLLFTGKFLMMGVTAGGIILLIYIRYLVYKKFGEKEEKDGGD
ncbi:hypothetical protein [Kosmotoga pacifica]|uniref:Uncharacterized protein n=1 Tax=Kosmotoga pacifica TaxID=1330330 RepID=A0A0G2Z6G8_9BACT|nr:hypothetical protein [Kosmotoga pacifica]AKI97195.1 hypothetical protein IX53_04515 [Kosmotoga pacifica]